MTSKHTPGPWETYNANDGTRYVETLGVAEPFDLARMMPLATFADAALIAAAPDLYQALRDAVAALGGIKSDNVPDSVREALAKAEGKP